MDNNPYRVLMEAVRLLASHCDGAHRGDTLINERAESAPSIIDDATAPWQRALLTGADLIEKNGWVRGTWTEGNPDGTTVVRDEWGSLPGVRSTPSRKATSKYGAQTLLGFTEEVSYGPKHCVVGGLEDALGVPYGQQGSVGYAGKQNADGENVVGAIGQAALRLCAYLNLYHGDDAYSAIESVQQWNDERARTGTEVVNAMRAAAFAPIR